MTESDLDTQGYVILKQCISSDILALFRRGFEASTTPHKGTRHPDLSETVPDFMGLLHLSSLLSRVTHVLGPHYDLRDAKGRDPLPGHGLQGLHRDWMDLSPGAPWEVCTALWLLDDFTSQNGATRLVPGSHRVFHPLGKQYREPRAHHPDEILIEAQAGDILFFNGHLIHGGTQNQSKGPRRVIQCVYQRT